MNQLKRLKQIVAKYNDVFNVKLTYENNYGREFVLNLYDRHEAVYVSRERKWYIDDSNSGMNSREFYIYIDSLVRNEVLLLNSRPKAAIYSFYTGLRIS